MQSGNTNVTIYYNNNNSQNVELSQLEISGFDTSTVGTKILSIKFNELTYSKTYQVKYKSIRNNSTNGIPYSFIANSNITLSKYKIDVEGYNGFKTIPLNDSSVTVEGLTAKNVLDSTSKYFYDASAKISCGGVNFIHNYSVWYTQGYNESLSGQKISMDI